MSAHELVSPAPTPAQIDAVNHAVNAALVPPYNLDKLAPGSEAQGDFYDAVELWMQHGASQATCIDLARQLCAFHGNSVAAARLHGIFFLEAKDWVTLGHMQNRQGGTVPPATPPAPKPPTPAPTPGGILIPPATTPTRTQEERVTYLEAWCHAIEKTLHDHGWSVDVENPGGTPGGQVQP